MTVKTINVLIIFVLFIPFALSIDFDLNNPDVPVVILNDVSDNIFDTTQDYIWTGSNTFYNITILNYSGISFESVNMSDFWDSYDVPSDINISLFNNDIGYLTSSDTVDFVTYTFLDDNYYPLNDNPHEYYNSSTLNLSAVYSSIINNRTDHELTFKHGNTTDEIFNVINNNTFAKLDDSAQTIIANKTISEFKMFNSTWGIMKNGTTEDIIIGYIGDLI